jgi:hypothetical protein
MLPGVHNMRRGPCSKGCARPAAHAALADFSKRRKRKRRAAPTLALPAAKAQGLYPPPFFDDFDFFAFKSANSAACNMAANFWPFFF